MNKKIITVGEMFSGPGGIGLALNKAENDKFRFVHVRLPTMIKIHVIRIQTMF